MGTYSNTLGFKCSVFLLDLSLQLLPVFSLKKTSSVSPSSSPLALFSGASLKNRSPVDNLPLALFSFKKTVLPVFTPPLLLLYFQTRSPTAPPNFSSPLFFFFFLKSLSCHKNPAPTLQIFLPEKSPSAARFSPSLLHSCYPLKTAHPCSVFISPPVFTNFTAHHPLLCHLFKRSPHLNHHHGKVVVCWHMSHACNSQSSPTLKHADSKVLQK